MPNNTPMRRPSAEALLIGSLLVCLVAHATPHADDLLPKDLQVTGGRPLNDALTTIEQAFGVPVDFEEIVSDKSDLVSGIRIGLNPERFYLKGGTLLIHFPAPAIYPLAAVQTAVLANNRAALPGPYLVRQTGCTIHVYPSSGSRFSSIQVSIPMEKEASTTPSGSYLTPSPKAAASS